MIRVEVANAHPTVRISRRETHRLVRRVLLGERRGRASVGVVFVNDQRTISMNRRFLGRRSTTDVLSFPLTDRGDTELEGEVYVNLDRARLQARAYGVRVKDEVARLVVHGILHLIGHDDRSTHQQRRMTRREDRYLRELQYRIGDG